MLRRFAFWIADGSVFYPGLILLLMALGVFIFRKPSESPARNFTPSLIRITGILGGILIGLSSAPLPAWSYGLLIGLVVGCLQTRWARGRRPAWFAACLLGLGVMAVELRWARYTPIDREHGLPVYVLGDSITSDVATTYSTWPKRVAERAGMEILNFAHPGATSGDAMLQAKKIAAQPPGWVWMEIGGNNIMGFTDARTYSEEWEDILQTLDAAGHRLLVFELPLIPGFHAFGRAQREVARPFTVTWVPKRFLAGVLAIPGTTEDGLHLTQRGHDLLAERFCQRVLRLPEVAGGVTFR